jgi:hypothetical protein
MNNLISQQKTFAPYPKIKISFGRYYFVKDNQPLHKETSLPSRSEVHLNGRLLAVIAVRFAVNLPHPKTIRVYLTPSDELEGHQA